MSSDDVFLVIGWALVGWHYGGLLFERFGRKTSGADILFKPGSGWHATVFAGRKRAHRHYPESYCTEQVLDEVRNEIQDLRSAK